VVAAAEAIELSCKQGARCKVQGARQGKARQRTLKVQGI